MRVVFIIQGEGRGHLTQAISLHEQLAKEGHQVVGALVGQNTVSNIDFLEDQLPVPLHYFVSPGLVYSPDAKGVNLLRTIAQNLKNVKVYLKSIKDIQAKVAELKPDLVVNFYEVLAALAIGRLRNRAYPLVSIAHQYQLLQANFPFPKGRGLDRFLVKLHTRITALGSNQILGLSWFRNQDAGKIISVPPLIREAVMSHVAGKENYFLAYLTNECMLPDLINWSFEHPEQEIHCFYKHQHEQDVYQINPKLFVHRPHPVKYLRLMANCKGLVTTAGFESVAEALYFDKPLLMIPVKGHYEQMCNAAEAVSANLAITAASFDLDDFKTYASLKPDNAHTFQTWLHTPEVAHVKVLERVCKLYAQKHPLKGMISSKEYYQRIKNTASKLESAL